MNENKTLGSFKLAPVSFGMNCNISDWFACIGRTLGDVLTHGVVITDIYSTDWLLDILTHGVPLWILFFFGHCSLTRNKTQTLVLLFVC